MAELKVSQLNPIAESELAGSDLLLVSDLSVPESKSLRIDELDKRYPSITDVDAVQEALEQLEDEVEDLDAATVKTTGDQSITGTKTFSSILVNGIMAGDVQADATAGVIAELPLPTKMIVQFTDATEIQSIAESSTARMHILTNLSASPILIKNQATMPGSGIYTGTGEDLELAPAASIMVYGGPNGWFVVGGSGSGGGGAKAGVFYENDQHVTEDYEITSGKNAMSAGPITIDDGVTVTVPLGSEWTIV